MSLNKADPFAVIARLENCWNAHDLTGLLACYHSDYESLNPCNPERNFTGLVKLRASWESIFDSLPDFQAELKSHSVTGNTVWTEWRWHGCHLSGVLYESVGVMIFETEGEQIRRTTIYSRVLTNEGPNWDNVINDLLNE